MNGRQILKIYSGTLLAGCAASLILLEIFRATRR